MSVPETKTVDEIPASMQKLARLVVRGFFGVEHSVLMDLLIRNVCMREEDLRDLLRFDAKQLRTVLISLKNSKLIKERQLVEQRAENSKPIRHNYYFINYRALLSIMKYKIDHMRRKLESEEKTSTHRSTFKCSNPTCKKPYSDLDINLLWNGTELQCTFCRSLVEEDSSALPNQDTRSSLARFNEQMWPFFQLMQELEGVQLALHLLEPTPMVVSRRSRGGADGVNSADRRTPGGQDGTSANRGSRPDTDYEPYRAGFTVSIDGSAAADSSATKEVPAWLLPGAEGASSPTRHIQSAGLLGVSTTICDESPPSLGDRSPRREIADALLVHESAAAASRGGGGGAGSLDRSTPPRQVAEGISGQGGAESDEEDDFEEVADDSDDEATSTVTVQGLQYSLADVTEDPDLIAKMTPDEKQHYVHLSQLAFKRMYGD